MPLAAYVDEDRLARTLTAYVSGRHVHTDARTLPGGIRHLNETRR